MKQDVAKASRNVSANTPHLMNQLADRKSPVKVLAAPSGRARLQPAEQAAESYTTAHSWGRAAARAATRRHAGVLSLQAGLSVARTPTLCFKRGMGSKF